MTAGGGAGESPDALLVQRALQGEGAAFTLLISRHKTWLFRFIRRFVGKDEDAFDVLQDTLVAVWISLDRYDSARPFNAWIRQIALNKCRDWARRRVLRNVVGLFGDLDLFAADPRKSNPETGLMADQVLDRLDRAIVGLPHGLRAPLILSTFEGLSHREIAEQLGISEKAVEMRIYRARQQLSRVMQITDPSSLIEDLMR